MSELFILSPRYGPYWRKAPEIESINLYGVFYFRTTALKKEEVPIIGTSSFLFSYGLTGGFANTSSPAKIISF